MGRFALPGCPFQLTIVADETDPAQCTAEGEGCVPYTEHSRANGLGLFQLTIVADETDPAPHLSALPHPSHVLSVRYGFPSRNVARCKMRYEI